MKAVNLLKLSLKLVLFAGSAVIVIDTLLAQQNRKEDHETKPGPLLYIDHADFKSDTPGKVRLEVYYQLYNFGLQFDKKDSLYVAEYEVSAVIRDDDGKQAAAESKDKTVVLSNSERIRSRFDFRTSQLNFDLDPGKYTVEFSLRDRKTRLVTNKEIKMKLEDYGRDEPLMSAVEFAHVAQQTEEENGLFNKGVLKVIPSVTRAFGGDDESTLLYYFELYPGQDSESDVVVETILRHYAKGMLYRDTLHVKLDKPVIRQLREISITDLEPGNYEMEIYLRGRRNKKLDEQKQELTLLWSQYGLIRNDWKTVMNQIQYIATSEEIDKVKNVTTLEERKSAFDQFWESRDPTLGTPENETKREFYRRVNYTNERFTSGHREGWKSDRGRVYIVHGEPDRIDDQPFSPSEVPYQIWHYYYSGQYLRFTFVDENEDGDYRLQYPYDGRNQRPDF
ncbi:MAG: GWxTD domain-containing protein [candidate division Zixibacteria bacterium]|nr:GWxTD domain-containing protein [candidate division Zixibacteria bacterium]